MKPSKAFNLVLGSVTALALIASAFSISRWLDEARIYKKMVERLTADTRIAEVLVTKSEFNETTKKIETTIKFLEYDVKGKAIPPKYFTFQGNIIQFQSLVVRFGDDYVKRGDRLKGKSAYLFMKAFILDGEKTQSFDITKTRSIPEGYQVDEQVSDYEQELWTQFWDYALDPEMQKRTGVKNAQLEAPGSMFIPGTIYTVRIEHDGGLRIDAQPIPEILKGELL